MNTEIDRFSFITSRDGLQETINFARRTMRIYRTAILNSRKRGVKNPHYASLPEYKEGFIRSYLAFKAFLKKYETLEVV